MLKLLIVDDEDIIRKGLCDYIDWASVGVRVVADVSDGAEGILAFKKHEPDIILCDVVMPGMNGITFCRKIRNISPDASIIMISAYQDVEYIRAAFGYQAVDYILKPFQNEELLEIVNKAARQVEQIRIQRQQQSQMENRIKENIPLLRQVFIHDLVLGCLSDIRLIEEKLCFLEIPLSPDTPSCVILSIIDSVSPDNYGVLTGDTIGAELRSLLEIRNLQGTVCQHKENQWIFLMQWDAIYSPDIRRLADEIRERFNKEFNLQVTLGIGKTVPGLLHIVHSYKEAETACSYKMLLGRNQVINYQDITPKTIRELPVQIREIHSEIISMAGTGEISWAVARIHLLFDQLKQFGVLDLHYIVAVCTDIYTSMVERTAGLSHADRESEIYRFIQEIGTLTFIQDMEQLMVKEILRFDQLMRNMRHVDTPRAVRSAKEFIAHWYMDHLTLKDIADKVYLTPTYLAALFKKETGLTINEYLTQIRIERAKELLRDIGLSIQDVSEAVGYQDSRYFSRLFKNMTGGTPAWYRRHGT